MPYLIDGHNLIPFMHGMSLDQLDDELRLIDFLEAYFRKIRKKASSFSTKGGPAAIRSSATASSLPGSPARP